MQEAGGWAWTCLCLLSDVSLGPKVLLFDPVPHLITGETISIFGSMQAVTEEMC